MPENSDQEHPIVHAQFPRELRDRLAQSASDHDRSFSAELREAARLYVGANDTSFSWDDEGGDGLSSGRRPPSARGQS
jgi:hypothetical protein